jgi:glutathione S-transferase
MRIYGDAKGSNCRRVTIYMAEKGLDVELVEVDLAGGEHKTEAFRAKNPAGLVPVLEADDGTYIPESSAIVEYLEDIYPEPPMIGETAELRGRVRAIERIASDLAIISGVMLLHSLPRFAGRVEQNSVVADAMRPMVNAQLDVLEKHLGGKPFLASDRPTIADITLFSFIQAFKVRMDVSLTDDHPNLHAWYARFEARPSAAF